MSKSSASTAALPPKVLAKLEDLGRRIKLARKRRGLTALLTLGLEDDLDNVAAMETDMIGLAHERRRLEGKTDGKDKISYDF